jgi:hypothetical protein
MIENADMPGKIETARLVLRVLGWLSVATAVVLSMIFVFGSLVLGLSGKEQAVVGSAVLGGLGRAIFAISLLLAVLFLLTARGIARRKAWAKPAGMVLAMLMLPVFPLGTVLGIFVLIGLLGREAKSWFAARKTVPGPSI